MFNDNSYCQLHPIVPVVALTALVLIVAAIIGSNPAPHADTGEGEVRTLILKELEGARPDLVFTDIKPSPLKGLYQVTVNGESSLHVSVDGKMAVAGTDLLAIDESSIRQVEDPLVQGFRDEFGKTVESLHSIDFVTATEAKAVVYVFTDADCGYCRLLHRQMGQYTDAEGQIQPGYNDLGIEIRYLAFPGAGVPSSSADKLTSAWCSDYPQAEITKLMAGEDISVDICSGMPIEDQYKAGRRIGVKGTPAMYLPNGTLLSGYLPPKALAEKLGIAAE